MVLRYQLRPLVNYLLPVAGALAGGVFSFGLPALLLPLLLMALVAFISTASGTRNRVFGLLLFIIPFHLVTLAWFLDSSPGNIHVSSALELPVKITCLLIMCGLFSVCMLPLAAVRLRGWGWLLFPATWIVCEWLRSVVTPLFLWGSGASLGDYFNYGSFGLATMNTPLSGLSRIVGMYGLSFIVVASCVLVFNALRNRRLAPVMLGLAVLPFAVGYGVLAVKPGAGHAPVKHGSLLQQAERVSSLEDAAVSNPASKVAKDIVVLPEYSDVFTAAYVPYARSVQQKLRSDGFSVGVSASAPLPAQPYPYGVLEFRNQPGHVLNTQTKELLIPTGEYMPAILSGYFKLTGQNQILQTFNQERRLQKGNAPEVFRHGSLSTGSMACSGILSRNIARHLTADGAEVLTNSANLLTFRGSSAFYRQSLLLAKFHAVANDRVFIQATQGAPGFVIDQAGRFIIKPERTTTRFRDFSFTAERHKTLYTKFGEWVLPLAIAILIPTQWFPAAWKLYRKRRG